MIRLRELQEKDAENMFEWMQDPDSQKGFQKDMLSRTLEDARDFCIESKLDQSLQEGQSNHYAIVDETDEYLGTISLKKMSMKHRSAEYAVVVRKKARGQGVAMEATGLLLENAFRQIGLHRVYLTVLDDNIGAIKFYEKCGFTYEGELRDHIYVNGRFHSWKIYGILEEEYSNESWKERMDRYGQNHA